MGIHAVARNGAFSAASGLILLFLLLGFGLTGYVGQLVARLLPRVQTSIVSETRLGGASAS